MSPLVTNRKVNRNKITKELPTSFTNEKSGPWEVTATKIHHDMTHTPLSKVNTL